MKLSLITIVLNDRAHIEKTILSVINQKADMEYIVIDGGSTDGTLDVLENHRDEIDVLISEKDNGIVDAFNKGIRYCSGEIIGIVNSGDWLEDGALKKVTETLTCEDAPDIIYGDVQYWQGDHKEYRYSADHTYLDKFMSINHPAVFVKKNIYDTYGLFDENFPVAMDYELMLRFYMHGVKFHYINQTLSNMALGGISDINWRQAYKEAYEIRKRHLGTGLTLYIDYTLQVFKRYISNILSSVGLSTLKALYRRYFSTIKKEKE